MKQFSMVLFCRLAPSVLDMYNPAEVVDVLYPHSLIIELLITKFSLEET